ncbi:AraC family transcriptional regulator [Mycobacterium sp. MS1601]|uniref:helix-turn-helix domain-containing protein n=1 Tax=Mycobacterium sp. MS1601 TaxID=1936029 RepID=UPI00097959B9|nr:AraC family transcriptional regulator [Mycobacterium sp. MS1601]
MTAEPSPQGRDRLRELLDAIVEGENSSVEGMARSTFVSEFHFSREVRRLTGEPPAALRRRIMLERAAWRLQRGEAVAAVAADEGWSSAEVFSRAFRRSFGTPPSQVGAQFRLPAPNGLHFHPPQSLWLDAEAPATTDVSALMMSHDIADTGYLLGRAAELTEQQWLQEVSPGQTVLDWDGPEPSVGAVLCAVVWAKEVWLASIEGRDFPSRDATDPARTGPHELATHHDDIAAHWIATITRLGADGRMGDTVIDALCDPPESFQLYGIVAHVLTYSAHRRHLARAMLARLGVETHRGDPLEWMRGS